MVLLRLLLVVVEASEVRAVGRVLALLVEAAEVEVRPFPLPSLVKPACVLTLLLFLPILMVVLWDYRLGYHPGR